jgi:hypothetical protein
MARVLNQAETARGCARRRFLNGSKEEWRIGMEDVARVCHAAGISRP